MSDQDWGKLFIILAVVIFFGVVMAPDDPEDY